MIFSVLIAVIVAAVLVVIIMFARSAGKNREVKNVAQKVQKKGRAAILKEAEKKLAKDPHNVTSLEMVGDIYYGEKNWEKVWNIYKTLYDISTVHPEIDSKKATLRMGIAAFYLDKIDDAISSLMLSMKKDPENFDCNFYLGQALYKAGTYDKAIYCFKKAKVLMPENNEVNGFLGQCLYKIQKYRDALPFLKRVLEDKPDNKEILFSMAISMAECGLGDKALKLFMHLRLDPEFGPQSCLEAGKMHERNKDYASAIKDYEIALKLPNIPPQLSLQIKYRMGAVCIAQNDISQGLTYLKQIQAVKSGYKDVDAMVLRYSELNQNKNLQTYLMSGTSDFVALCRKFISTYYKDAFVKVEDVQVSSESVEIVCNIENSKWEAKQIFRFYRNQNAIGDIYIREFHGKIRDTKCDAGICVTLGSFSDSAHKYTEGRPIDLIEKEELVKILKKINMFN